MADQYEKLRIARDSFRDLALDNARAADRLAKEVDQLQSDRTRLQRELDAVDLAFEGLEETDRARRIGHWIGLAAEETTRANAAEADRTRLEAENERLKAALKPFAALSFTFDGFSFDPAELVFNNRAYGPFWPTEHAAFEALIDAARAALAQPQPEERGPLPLDPSPQGEGGGEQGAPASPSGSQATPEAPTDPRPTGVDPSRGPAAQSCLDAAAAIEGIAQELDAYGRTAQGHILRCALDALLDVRTEGPLPPADESTEWLVSRARARFQAAIVKGEAGQ